MSDGNGLCSAAPLGNRIVEGFFFRSEKTFMLSFSDFIRFSVAIFPGMFLSRVYDKLLYNLGHQVVKKVVSKSSICLLGEHGSAAPPYRRLHKNFY